MKKKAHLLHPEKYPDMEYLLTDAAQTRCVIAAHFVRDCEHVVEIGGFTTPITDFLVGPHKTATVFDPLIRKYRSEQLPRGGSCLVKHVSLPFQEAQISYVPGSYGFVMLGASLKYFDKDPAAETQQWEKLNVLISKSKRAVIEGSIDWHLSQAALEWVQRIPQIQVRVDMMLDLGNNPGMDHEHYRRRLLVLEPGCG